MAHWIAKFRYASRGLWQGWRGQNSFAVHIAMALAVLVLAALVRPTVGGWCLLVLCITGVLAAEMFNTAVETLVRRLHPRHDPEIGKALDIAAAAVLIAAIGAAVVGLLVLGDAALDQWAR